jgi:hypothetical protein
VLYTYVVQRLCCSIPIAVVFEQRYLLHGFLENNSDSGNSFGNFHLH